MASNGNFGTWNPLADYSSGTTFSNGNCTTAISQQNQYRACLGPAIPDSGKWYIEFFIDNQSAGFPSDIGVLDGTINSSLSSGNYLSNAGSFHIEPMNGTLFSESTSGTSYTGNSGSPAAVGNADAKVGIAIDRDANKLWFAVNNTWINVGSGVGDPANGNNPAVSSLEQNLSISHGIRQATGTSKVVINCGQDSTFGGLATAGGNADGNGFGDFFYAPPTGFLALCSANLPISDDIDPAQTDDDYPGKNFNTVLFNGNGTTNAVTGLGFQPDFIWGFTRSGSQSKRMIDSSRGGASRIYSDIYNAVDTSQTAISAFGTDGFTANGGYFNNDSGKTCGAWCWRMNGGTTASNSDGNVTTTVQANSAAGQSIVQWTGTGTNSRTLGTGLSKEAEFIMIKDLSSSSYYWICYHKNVNAGSKPSDYGVVYLNTEDAYSSGSGALTYWDISEWTNSVFSVGGASGINTSGNSMLAYCFHSVEGYSKFGSYTGNANADGPFIYTGFRPRMLFIKQTDNTSNWNVFDTARDTHNYVSKHMSWDTSAIEYDGASYSLDVLSNGFKIRASWGSINTSGSNYIYGAWGDVPYKYNNTF